MIWFNRGTVGVLVFNNYKLHSKKDANRFYLYYCGFIAQLEVYAPFFYSSDYILTCN